MHATVAFLALFATCCSANLNAAGRNFVFAFPLNYEVSALSVPYVAISNPGLNVIQVTLQSDAAYIPGGSTTININPQTNAVYKFPMAVEVSATTALENKGIRITAQELIAVVGTVEGVSGYTTDSFMIFPAASLGTEYFAVTAEVNLANTFTIIADQDSTQYTVTFNGVTIASGTLNALQTYTYADSTRDLTGAHISVSKPAALISGQQCAHTGLMGACDMVVEMLPPTNSWGTQYTVTSLTPDINGDYLRVVAQTDGTTVYYKGVNQGTINRGQFLRFLIAANDYGLLSSNYPVQVIQVMQGQASAYSDPSFVLVPSAQTEGTYSLITTPGLYGQDVWDHEVVITTNTATTGSILIDGTAVNGWFPIPQTGKSGVHIKWAAGQHELAATGDATFSAISYGENVYCSYAFVASIALSSTNPAADPCVNNNCQNCATCLRQSDTTYTCMCKPGTAGQYCEIVTACTATSCDNGGICVPGTCSSGNSVVYSCTCPPGYWGDQCQNTNICASNPCPTGQTCSNVPPAGFACTCPVGTNCGNVNPCAPVNPCKNGGSCTNNDGNFQCTCPSGYTGPTCTQQNPCIPNNPCLNGGTCQNNNGNFQCTCPPGYMGATCNQPDLCNPNNPCQNGGTCINVGQTYVCTCPVGYMGPTCNQRNPCIPNNPCLNGGTCQDNNGNFQCTCPPGYIGTTCNQPDLCNPNNPCQNGGTCTNVGQTYVCTCPAEYIGPTCNQRNPCIPNNPCQNGGTCQINNGNFKCTCPPGYRGATCNQPDLCNPNNPCKNGGTCTNVGQAYVCTCPAGYIDPNCGTQNFCSSDPCENGATCINGQNGATCECPPTYLGPLCQHIDHCTPNPCKNNGICTNNPDGGYNCTCPAGYTGPECQLNMCHADFVYVVDTSDSICETEPIGSFCPYFANMLSFLQNFTDSFAVGESNSRFALVHFSDVSKTGVSFFLNTYYTADQIDNAAASLNYWQLTGDTDTGDALKLVRDQILTVANGDRADAPNIVIMFTDGEWNVGPDPVAVANDLWKRNDTFLYAVGIGDLISRSKLLQLVRSNENVYNVTGYLALGDDLKDNLLRATNCGKPQNDYCSPNPCVNHGTCVNQANTFICECENGFSGAHCEIVTPCNPSPCLNNGTCISNNGQSSCICHSKYIGQFCEEENPCGNEPCTVAPQTATPGFYGHCVPLGGVVNCEELPDGNYNDPTTPCSMHYYVCSGGYTFPMSCATETFYDCTQDLCNLKPAVPACLL